MYDISNAFRSDYTQAVTKDAGRDKKFYASHTIEPAVINKCFIQYPLLS